MSDRVELVESKDARLVLLEPRTWADRRGATLALLPTQIVAWLLIVEQIFLTADVARRSTINCLWVALVVGLAVFAFPVVFLELTFALNRCGGGSKWALTTEGVEFGAAGSLKFPWVRILNFQFTPAPRAPGLTAVTVRYQRSRAVRQRTISLTAAQVVDTKAALERFNQISKIEKKPFDVPSALSKAGKSIFYLSIAFGLFIHGMPLFIGSLFVSRSGDGQNTSAIGEWLANILRNFGLHSVGTIRVLFATTGVILLLAAFLIAQVAVKLTREASGIDPDCKKTP